MDVGRVGRVGVGGAKAYPRMDDTDLAFGSRDARDQRTIERLIAEHNEERGRCGREAPPPRPAVGDAGPATPSSRPALASPWTRRT